MFGLGVAAVLFAASAGAQVLYGTITGTATDTTGAVIPNATVTVKESATGVERSGTTSGEGIYSIRDLNPGTYTITITAPGFTTAQQNNVALLANTTQRADLQMKVGGGTQEVNVTDSGSYLNAPGNTQLADRNYNVNPYLAKRTNNVGLTNGFQYLNPAAFSSVTAATSPSGPRFGTNSRNSVRGPGFFNLDVSLKRAFPIHDRIGVEFQAESFDVTNTPQFANPGTTGINNVSVNPPATTSQLGAFGVITSSNVNRSLRLSGRVTF